MIQYLMDTLLIIDGNAIMHRAFHAIPPFKTSKGQSTNVVYGFLTMLYKVVTDFHPEHLIVCFDTPKPTFRNHLSKEYQAHRPKVDKEFITQIPLVRELIDRAGITRLEKDGYEADDVIGTIAKKFGERHKVIILTGDKDIFQLVNEHVVVLSPKFGFSETILYDKEAVLKKMGVAPELIPDYKALAGDSSDNYKGAKGIGPKTAASLLSEFGSVGQVISGASKIQNERIRGLITANEKNILLSHELATIKTDVPIDVLYDKTKFVGFNDELNGFLKDLEMNSLRNRIFGIKKNSVKLINKPKPSASDNQIKLF